MALPMFYVLHVAGPQPWVLNLEPQTRAAAQAAVSWQDRGGIPRSEFAICAYDADAREFVTVENVSYPLLGMGPFPYTPEAWAEFVRKLEA